MHIRPQENHAREPLLDSIADINEKREQQAYAGEHQSGIEGMRPATFGNLPIAKCGSAEHCGRRKTGVDDESQECIEQ